MNFIIHAPRLLNTNECFCFACIAIKKKNCMFPFFTFFFFCHQSSFRNRKLISCLIHMTDSVILLCVSPFSCVHPFYVYTSVCHFLCMMNHHIILSLDGIINSIECLRIAKTLLEFFRWKQCIQSSFMNFIHLILESSSQSMELLLLPTRMTPPKNLLLNAGKWHLSRILSSCSSWCRTTHTWRWECQLHVCHREIAIQILSPRKISSCNGERLLLLPLLPLMSRRDQHCPALWRQQFPAASQKIHP